MSDKQDEVVPESVADLKSTITTTRQKITLLEAKLKENKDSMDEIEAEAVQAQQQMRHAIEEEVSYKEIIAQCEALKDESDGMFQMRERILRDVMRLRSEAKSAREQNRVTKNFNSSLREEKEEYIQRNTELRRRISSNPNQAEALSQLETDLAEVQAQHRRLRDDNLRRRKDIDDAKTSAKRAASLSTRLEVATQRANIEQETVDAAQTELDQVQKTIRDQQAELDMCKTQRDDYKNQLEAGRAEIRRLLEQANYTPPEPERQQSNGSRQSRRVSSGSRQSVDRSSRRSGGESGRHSSRGSRGSAGEAGLGQNASFGDEEQIRVLKADIKDQEGARARAVNQLEDAQKAFRLELASAQKQAMAETVLSLSAKNRSFRSDRTRQELARIAQSLMDTLAEKDEIISYQKRDAMFLGQRIQALEETLRDMRYAHLSAASKTSSASSASKTSSSSSSSRQPANQKQKQR